MHTMTLKTYLTSENLLMIEAILSSAGLGTMHRERGTYGRFLIGMMETGTQDRPALSAALQRELGTTRFRQCWQGAPPMHRFATQGMLR